MAEKVLAAVRFGVKHVILPESIYLERTDCVQQANGQKPQMFLRRQAVILGTLSAGDARQVLSGVVAGDRVVVAPADGLADGAAASVKP